MSIPDIHELADWCVETNAPYRELDALIEIQVRRWQAYEVGLNDKQRAHWKLYGVRGEVEDGGCRYHAPTYSFEIDKAILLVPENWVWQISNRAPLPHNGRAYIHNKELQGAGLGHLGKNPRYRGEETTAATPALALCAAALRARASTLTPAK